MKYCVSVYSNDSYIMNIPDIAAEDELGVVTVVDIVVFNITKVVVVDTTRQ